MSAFAALLARPHAQALAAACALGWLAFASVGVTIVLLVHDATGSFAVAGAAAGAFSAAAGALAPLRGRLVDRHGGVALLPFAITHAVLLLVLLSGGILGWSPLALIAAAAAAGAAAPPLIASARARWPHVAGAELARTGHALNALLGDLGAVAGPALAGALALAAGPAPALAAIAFAPVASALLLGRIGEEEPRGRGGERRASEPPAARVLRGNPGMHTVIACELVLGALLGAVELLAPAVADRAGSAALGAAPLAAFAAGSVVSSLWSGSGDIGPPRTRYVAGFALLGLVLSACAVARSVAALSLVLTVAGVGYGLLNVGLLELLDDLVPSRNAVEALTWVTTAQGLGLALGGIAAGALATTSPDAALTLVAVVAPLGALLAVRRRATLPGPHAAARRPSRRAQ
jgi:MFS family permease